MPPEEKSNDKENPEEKFNDKKRKQPEEETTKETTLINPKKKTKDNDTPTTTTVPSSPVNRVSPLPHSPTPVPKKRPTNRRARELTTSYRSIDQLFELCYEIPEYKSPYAWEVENIKDLLTDIFNEYNKNEEESGYFLGSIMLKAGIRHQVIDGQQRLISLAILYSALRECIDKTCSKEAKRCHDDISNSYLTIQKGELAHEARIVVCNDEKGFAGKDSTFFQKYIVNPNGFERMLHIGGFSTSRFKKSDIEEVIEKLEEAHEIGSTSAMNCGYNFLHTILKIKKLFKTTEEIVDFMKFVSNNCSVVTTTVPEHPNGRDLGTLRGKDMYPMDKLKYDFGRLFSSSNREKTQIVDPWNTMYPEIGEEFPNILENIYQLQHPTKKVNINSREYAKLLEEIATGMKKQKIDEDRLGEVFLKNYMTPLYNGHMSKTPSSRPTFSSNKEKNDLINKMISRTYHIATNYLPKTQRIASDIVLATLIAISHCKETGENLLTFPVSSIDENSILKMISIWSNHVLLVCLCNTGKVQYSYMMKEIMNCLTLQPVNFTTLEEKLTKSTNFNSWKRLIQRHIFHAPNKPTQTKQSSDQKKIFSTLLPVINDYLEDPLGKKDHDLSTNDKLKLFSIQKPTHGVFEQLGNYTLAKSCKLEAIKSENLPINERFQQLDDKDEFTEKECEKRCEELIDIINKILEQMKKFFK